jgi:hypothetical protein
MNVPAATGAADDRESGFAFALFSGLLRVGLTPPAVRLALLLGVLVRHR